MEVWFTSRDHWFSNLIRSLTGEEVSHTVIKLGYPICIHSNKSGPHLETDDNIRDENAIYHKLRYIGQGNIDARILKNFSAYEFKIYDFFSILFIGLSLILRKNFNIPLPKSNLWQITGMYQCVELASIVIDDKKDVSMMTPFGFYGYLLKTELFEIIND